MPGILLEQLFPSATTCVFVGGFSAELHDRLTGYQNVLWFVDSDSSLPQPTGLGAQALEIVSLETAAAGNLQPALDRFVARNSRRLPSLLVSDSILASRVAPAYERIITDIHLLLEAHHRARVTRQKDGFRWQQQLLQNFPAYTRRRLPSAWAGALRGIPAYICGAGPSFDVSVPHLAAAASAAVVFAADSALRTLARHGVTADFAVSVDAAKTPEKCLPPDFLPTRVVLSAISPPAWKEAVPPERQFFLSSNQITIDWAAAQGIARTIVSVAENCGSTAIELARFLGCAPIYFFGLDFAVDAGQPARRHTAGADPALYAESGFDATQAMPRVPGNYTANVPTHVLGDLNALNKRLYTWPAGLVYNVNDRGAQLTNTTLVSPADFSPPESAVPKQAALDSLSPVVASAPDHIFALLRTMGDRCLDAIPQLQRALDFEGPAPLVNGFRTLFRDQEVGRMLGAFSLKIMPHLIPPIEGERPFWQTQVDEFSVLAELARTAGT